MIIETSLTLALLCLCFCVYQRWQSVKNYWVVRNVPYESPHMILGSLTFMFKENNAYWFRRCYERFTSSPYFGIWLFWRPALVINSYELAQRVLSTDSDNFRDRFLGTGKKDPFGSNLFLGRGPECYSIRKRLSAVFTSSKLKATQQVMAKKSKELVERICTEQLSNKSIDLRTTFIDYATDVVSISSFGVEGDATLTGTSPMREVTRELAQLSVSKGLIWCCIFYFPELTELFRINFFPQRTVNYFRKIFADMVYQRGGYDTKIVHVTDIMDALIKMKQDTGAEGGEMKQDVLVAQAAIMVYASFETTSMILSFTIYELAFADPNLQEKIYEELIAGKNKATDSGLDSNLLSKLTFFNCAIQETLRKYPGMAWLDRVAKEDYKVDDNLTIPAGTPVYVNCYGMHYDPKYYPNPDKYDPDRFLPENQQPNGRVPFLAFGDGPRHCIGERFGYQAVRFALAEIIMHFHLRPLPNYPPPSEPLLEKNHLLVQPVKLSVQFIPRTGN